MTDRRGTARYLTLILAGLAVAGTGAATPSPAPTQRIDLSGSVHVSDAAPVAVQPIDVQIGAGDPSSLDFSVVVREPPEEGTVLVTIVAGPLNYVGANPRIHKCNVPQPSK